MADTSFFAIPGAPDPEPNVLEGLIVSLNTQVTTATTAADTATNAANTATIAAASAAGVANSVNDLVTLANETISASQSGAATATQKATEAASSADAAAASVASMGTSAADAALSATAAANSATSAASSATGSAGSATTAATQATNAASSATSAGNSASSASTSATNAASSASSASSSASTATTQASAASTSASNAATSATAAASSASAASTSATNAASSATSASGSASTATTQASAASTSASNASTSATNAASSATAASGYASAASTSATNAASSASAAGTSATAAASSASAALTSKNNAATSETNAATSATNAASSATAASTSATNAASTLTAFKGQYYGNLSADPTLDPNGNAMGAGDLYYNTVSNAMKVYSGTAWQDVGKANIDFFKFVATAGQTTFSGTDANSKTLAYTVNFLNVFHNGVLLDRTDYTATNGTSVVLGAGAAASDEIVIQAFGVFTVANTYTTTQTDSLLAAKQPLNSALTAIAANNGNSMFKNRIINGAMMIDQRNAGVVYSMAGGSLYTLDRWLAYGSQVSKFTVQQNAGSVTPPVGYTNYLGVTSASSYSIAATDQFFVSQTIEGNNVADLAWGTASATSITISFWVRSSLTGSFGGALSNNGSSRNFPFAFTINTANTWEQKSITVAGDTSGTWLTNNGAGLRIDFNLGTGATYSATAGSWTGTSFITAPTGATSVVGTSGATFYITGVQLEKGSTATSFDYRPYGTELALCQRYYEDLKSVYVWTTASNYPGYYFKVSKRATPTIAGGGSGFSAPIVTTESIAAASQTTANTQSLNASAEL